MAPKYSQIERRVRQSGRQAVCSEALGMVWSQGWSVSSKNRQALEEGTASDKTLHWLLVRKPSIADCKERALEQGETLKQYLKQGRYLKNAGEGFIPIEKLEELQQLQQQFELFSGPEQQQPEQQQPEQQQPEQQQPEQPEVSLEPWLPQELMMEQQQPPTTTTEAPPKQQLLGDWDSWAQMVGEEMAAEALAAAPGEAAMERDEFQQDLDLIFGSL